MNTQITTETTESTIFVKMPFELKEVFKEAFKTSTWDRYNKAWTIKNNTRNINKLEKFKADVSASGILEQIESEIAANELMYDERKVTEALEEAKSKLSKLEESKARAKESAKIVESMKAQLDEVNQKIEIEIKEKEAALATVKERIDSTIDIKEVKDLIHTMKKVHDSMTRIARVEFQEAQGKLNAIDDKLEEAGIVSKGIRYAVQANKNRPDRDKLSVITDEMIYTIVESDED